MTELDYSELRQGLREAPALSVKQPWAELILQRRKTVELRTWTTNRRGWIWLHTGKLPVPGGAEYFHLHNLFCGGYVGAFCLLDVESLDQKRWTELQSAHLDPGQYQVGVYAWTLKCTVRLNSPLTASGATGLFAIDPLILQPLSELKFVGEP